MRIGDEQAMDEILLLRLHAGAALAAAPLRAIGRERHALDVAGVRDGDDHVFARDQVLVLDLAVGFDDLRAARRGVGVLHREQFVLDDAEQAFARAQNVEIIGDLDGELVQRFGDFLASERREPLQTQIENGARLRLRKADGAVIAEPVTRIGDQLDERRHVLGRPVARHQRFARRGGVGRRADEMDDLVDIRDRDGEADLQMGVVARLVEAEFGAARDDRLAEIDEGAQHVMERHQLRAAAVQRDHIDGKACLQRRMTPKLVENDVGDSVALQFDDDAHAVAIGLVAQIGDALDLLLPHQIGDALDQRRLVHLIGNFGEDDRLAILAQSFDL